MCMVAVLPPNDGREAADRRCANAELGALHGAVRSRTRVRLEQAPARRWNSSDFCRDCPSHFHEVDLRSAHPPKKKPAPKIHFMKMRRTIPAKIRGIPTPCRSLFQADPCS